MLICLHFSRKEFKLNEQSNGATTDENKNRNFKQKPKVELFPLFEKGRFKTYGSQDNSKGEKKFLFPINANGSLKCMKLKINLKKVEGTIRDNIKCTKRGTLILRKNEMIARK